MHNKNIKTLKYRPDIDGLRSIAVLLVVIFHFNLIPGAKSGFMGVDVFYVISGFLITAILIKQLDAGTFSFSSFYVHRIRRLGPALFAVLALVMLAGYVLLFPAAFEELAKQVLVSQFYAANIYYWRFINYFGLHADNIVLLHTWSLAVEEQFYLLYPLVVYLIHRHWRARLWWILAIGFLASFALNLYFVSSKPEASFYLLPTRAWELLAGSLGYHIATRFARPHQVNEWLGLCGLALIAGGVVTYSQEIAFPGVFALLPVMGTAFILVGGQAGQLTVVSRILGVSPAVYIGRISYTLYLVHWPVNVFAHQIFAQGYTASIRVAMFLFSIALSAVIFHLIESPIRSNSVQFSRRWVAKAYGVGLAITIGLVSITVLMQGLPQRFPAEAMRLANYVKDGTQVPACEYQGNPLSTRDHFCRIGAKGVEPEWLIYGDSHAAAAYGAFDQWLAGQGKAGLFMFRNSCMPVAGLHVFKDKGLCLAFNDAVEKYLAQPNAIRNVFLVSCWRQPIERGGVSPAVNTLVSRDQSVGHFENQLTESLENLHRLGKRVYVWEPVPGARGNVPVEMAKAEIAGQTAEIEFSKDEYLSEFAFFFSALDKNRDLIQQTFSPSIALCASGTCQVVVNGNPLYHDNAHVSQSSAGFWAANLSAQLKP